MERFKATAREFVVRTRARLAALKARAAASGVGVKWAALPPRTQRLIAGGGAGVLVLVFVAALVLGPLSGHGAGGSGHSAGTPGVAAASSSESAAASASSTANATPVAAKVLATVDCGGGTQPATSGGRLYVMCFDDESVKVIAIDLASDKVVKTYKLPFSAKFDADTLIVDGGLWVGATDVEGPPQSDPTFTYETVRLDLASGSRKTDLKHMELIADLEGTIVATDEDGLPYKINAATGAKSLWNSTNVQSVVENEFASAKCGSLWDLSGESDGLVGVDPATGKATTIPLSVDGGKVVDILQSGKTCWVEIDTSPSSGDPYSDPATLAQLGPTCMGPASRQSFTYSTYEVGGTFWEILAGGISQVDPVAGKVGPTYWVPTSNDGLVTLADGQFWLATDKSLVRLDIPVDQMAPAPTPVSLTCAGSGNGPVDDEPIPTDSPTQSPSPSPSSSASASASPSISSTPSPTPTGTPVATATASPTNSPAPSESADASAAP